MRFKYYLLTSLITHLIILIFSPVKIEKENLIGEKIIPIEIINNESFNSLKGNTNKNSKNTFPKKAEDINKKLIKNFTKKKTTQDFKSKDKNDDIKGDFIIKKKQINKKTKIDKDYKDLKKENQINREINKKLEKDIVVKEKELDTDISNPQTKGLSNNDNKRDIEKGSIKGKGKLKITCLNCISPKYPRKALKKGLEGKPTVKVWILKSGNVEKVELIISSGINSIDNAALEAALKSKFYPIEFNSNIKIEYDLKLR